MSDLNCIVCGKAYKYCPKCGSDNKTETWRALFCSANCKGIYHICEEYAFGRLDGVVAKSQLKNLDLTNKDEFNQILAKNVADILNTEPPIVTVEVVEEPKIEKKKNRFYHNVNEIVPTKTTEVTE